MTVNNINASINNSYYFDKFKHNKGKYKPIQMTTAQRNYVVVDKNKTDYYLKQGKNALPELEAILKKSNNEAEIVETLYIIDKMLDKKIKGVDKMYPTLSRFNDTKSPDIQTFLAGIYRKTQVPDAFGPLVTMLIQNSINPNPALYKNFNPNEEIGGAIISYLA